MKHSTTRFRLLTFLLLFFAAFPPLVQASHEMGGDLTFECQNACTTRVYLRVYRDCSGVAVISSNVIITGNGGGCTSPVAIGGWSPMIVTEVTPICPSTPTRCTDPLATLSGVEEFMYYRDYDVCQQPNCSYTFSWTDCCRNPAITSFTNPGSEGIHVQATYSSFNSCNSSPLFTSPPVFYACAGSSYNIHQGAYDDDGDSLSYSLGPCYGSAGVQTVYNPGYSPTAPLGTSWNVSLNSVTGMITLSPNPGNMVVGVVCIIVNEYRNGVLIGSYTRDMQITVINCPGNTNPQITSMGVSSGCGVVSGDTVYTCGMSPVCVDIQAADPDAGQSLRIYWDQHVPGLSFYNPSNPAQQDTVLGNAARFCFTPTASGVYQFLVSVEDNFCPVYGTEDRFITIYVPAGINGNANAVQTGCNTADFTASAYGVPGPITYNWSGTGGLTGTGPSLTWTYPGPGTYTWTCVATDGTYSHTMNGTVVIDNHMNLIAGPSPLVLCNNPIVLAVPSGAAYLWSNGASTQTVQVNTPGPWTVQVVDANGCVMEDSVYVTQQGPTWQALFTQGQNIPGCPAAPLTLGVNGTWSTYYWNTTATAPAIMVTYPGQYEVTVEDANGCEYYDSTTVGRSGVDVYGYVNSSAGLPLGNEEVYIIAPDAQGLPLRRDSVMTHANGYYEFCTVADTLFALWARPDQFTWPSEMPTYADTGLVLPQATMYNQSSLPASVNWSTLGGVNPGGNGNIQGNLVQGTNKTHGPGDPMPGVKIWLLNMQRAPVASAVTDAAGNFSFSNLAYGDYYLVADAAGRDPLFQTPQVTLSASTPSLNVTLALHSTWLELVTQTQNAAELQGYYLEIGPNPVNASTRMILEIPQGGKLSFTLHDAQGRSLLDEVYPQVPAGTYEVPLPQAALLPAGVYFYQAEINGKRFSGKLLRF